MKSRKPPGPPKRFSARICVMLTADLRERLDEKAERLGLSRGAAVRDAVADYVNDGAALISRQVARGP